MAASGQDRGYAWVVCAASFMTLTIVGSFIKSPGMFFILFQDGLEAADKSALALITSLNMCFLCIACPIAGLLAERFSSRPVAMVGAVLSTVGYAISSLSTEVYHLWLSYGVLAGFGMGMVYNTSSTILSEYFNKHRRTACGLATCGIPVGASIAPPIIKALEDAYGWRGATLMMSGICAQSLVFTSLFKPLKENKEHQNCELYSPTTTSSISEGISDQYRNVKTSMLDVEDQGRKARDRSSNILTQLVPLFKKIPFVSLCVHELLLMFPLFIVFTLYGSYVQTLGYSSQDVVFLYMTMGITSIITPGLTGYLADVTKVNTFALVMTSIIILGICTICLPLSHNISLLYAYAVAIQTLMAPFYALFPVIVMENVPKHQVPSAFGITNMFCIPGVTFGAPFAALLYRHTGVYGYSFYLAGVLFLLAALVMTPGAWAIYKQNSVNSGVQTKENEQQRKE